MDYYVINCIKQFANQNGYSYRANYSGRGMYGKECIGIVMPGLSGLVGLVGFVVFFMEQDGFETFEVINMLADVKTDSMGFETIFYFPYLHEDEGYYELFPDEK